MHCLYHSCCPKIFFDREAVITLIFPTRKPSHISTPKKKIQTNETGVGEMSEKSDPNQTGWQKYPPPRAITFYELTETVLEIKVEASAKFTNSVLLNNTNRHLHPACLLLIWRGILACSVRPTCGESPGGGGEARTFEWNIRPTFICKINFIAIIFSKIRLGPGHYHHGKMNG